MSEVYHCIQKNLRKHCKIGVVLKYIMVGSKSIFHNQPSSAIRMNVLDLTYSECFERTSPT